MKIKFALIASALLMTTPVLAQERASADATCSIVSGVATSIMRARQKGVLMQSLMDLFNKPGEYPVIGDMARRLTIDAYEEPQYSSSEYQQRAVNEFTNRATQMCYRTMADN